MVSLKVVLEIARVQADTGTGFGIFDAFFALRVVEVESAVHKEVAPVQRCARVDVLPERSCLLVAPESSRGNEVQELVATFDEEEGRFR